MRSHSFFTKLVLAAAIAGQASVTALAQAPTPAPVPAPVPTGEAGQLHVELNALQKSDRGCRFTFMAKNDLGAELSEVAFELAMFDKAGQISRITIVDFKDLPDGKSKVRQFDFSGLDCAELGRVLINDVSKCSGSGVEPGTCLRRLSAETRTDVVFGV